MTEWRDPVTGFDPICIRCSAERSWLETRSVQRMYGHGQPTLQWTVALNVVPIQENEVFHIDGDFPHLLCAVTRFRIATQICRNDGIRRIGAFRMNGRCTQRHRQQWIENERGKCDMQLVEKQAGLIFVVCASKLNLHTSHFCQHFMVTPLAHEFDLAQLELQSRQLHQRELRTNRDVFDEEQSRDRKQRGRTESDVQSLISKWVHRSATPIDVQPVQDGIYLGIHRRSQRDPTRLYEGTSTWFELSLTSPLRENVITIIDSAYFEVCCLHTVTRWMHPLPLNTTPTARCLSLLYAFTAIHSERDLFERDDHRLG